ncbi:DNA-binding protein YbaB [Nocardia sp. GAS34]|uniref:YbaB/EbfC family nucleoid-associated protein n=1 Tax=unclassified Nocardia TaxID=2637762 RepID=UPI003D1982E5
MSERGRGGGEDLMPQLQEHLQALTEARQQRARLTASATSRDRRVTITVDANGVIASTRFADDIGELVPDELARMVTQVAQEAAKVVARRNQELVAALAAQHGGLSEMAQRVTELPTMGFEMSVPAPLFAALQPSEQVDGEDSAPPGSAENRGRPSGAGGVPITESSW